MNRRWPHHFLHGGMYHELNVDQTTSGSKPDSAKSCEHLGGKGEQAIERKWEEGSKHEHTRGERDIIRNE
jgi:hypothetical protein